MSGNSKYRILIVGLALALASLACLGGVPDLPFAGDDVDAEALIEQAEGLLDEAGDIVEESQAAGDDNTPLTYNGIDLSGLTSYRAQFMMVYSGTDENGQAVEFSYTFNESVSTNPAASYFSWTGQGTDVGLQSMGTVEFIQIGDVSYMLTDDGSGTSECLTFSQQEGGMNQAAFTPDNFLLGTDLSNAQRILPNENVNGVMTRHYRATAAEALLVGLNDYTLDIWVAVDGGYPVRQTLVAQGSLMGYTNGTGNLEWTYDVLDINGPVDIQAPANCEAPAGSDFPQMPDAVDVTSFGEILTYTTPSSAADVSVFYQAQLPPLGWVAGEITDAAGMLTQVYTRGDEIVTLTIVGVEGSPTNVLATFE